MPLKMGHIQQTLRILNQRLSSGRTYGLSPKVWEISAGPDNRSFVLCRRQSGLSRILPSLCSDISCLQLAALVSAGSLSAAQENIWKE